MRFDRSDHCSLSGVPLVIDRFGLIGGTAGDGIIDPLSTARGLIYGLCAALFLWIAIAALLRLA